MRKSWYTTIQKPTGRVRTVVMGTILRIWCGWITSGSSAASAGRRSRRGKAADSQAIGFRDSGD